MREDQFAELQDYIREAFPVDLPPEVLIQHSCNECYSLQKAFIGKRWTEVPGITIVENYDKLPLFTPEAFAFYVPAFMTFVLREATQDDSVLEFLIYSLSPSGDNSESFLNLRKEKLNSAQRKAICNFLHFVRIKDDSFESDIAGAMKFFDCANLSD